ncbi:MAG: ribbon-helix-helix protein, CopG family [Actinomycetota bacterium]
MEKTTLYLPSDLQAGLRSAARRTGKPQAQIVREAVEKYLADLPADFPASIGLAKQGDPSWDARDIEQILDEEWGRGNPR